MDALLAIHSVRNFARILENQAEKPRLHATLGSRQLTLLGSSALMLLCIANAPECFGQTSTRKTATIAASPVENTAISEKTAIPEKTTTLENAALAEPAKLPQVLRPKAIATLASSATGAKPSSASPKGSSAANQNAVVLAQWVSDFFQQPNESRSQQGPVLQGTVLQGPVLQGTVQQAIQGVAEELSLHPVTQASDTQSCEASKSPNPNSKIAAPTRKPTTLNKCAADQTDPNSESVAEPVVEQPILAAPVAPPVPPSFPFAMHSSSQDTFALGIADELNLDHLGGLEHATVAVPLRSLIGTMISHTENRVRLEMTEQWMAERASIAQSYHLLLEQNQMLQHQLAVLDSRQRVQDDLTAALVERTELAVQMLHQNALQSAYSSHNGTNSAEIGSGTLGNIDVPQQSQCESLTAARDDWDTIQEDLSNIRRQIAILKQPNPVPFAPSDVGIPGALEVPGALEAPGAAEVPGSRAVPGNSNSLTDSGLMTSTDSTPNLDLSSTTGLMPKRDSNPTAASSRRRPSPYVWPVPYTPLSSGTTGTWTVPSQATGKTGSLHK